jgi:hypothetical protein
LLCGSITRIESCISGLSAPTSNTMPSTRKRFWRNFRGHQTNQDQRKLSRGAQGNRTHLMLDRGLQQQGEFELNLGVAIGTLER